MQKLRSVDKVLCRHTGDLHTETLHHRSGQLVHTDAPVDHAGKGENFAPTDLVATALGSCFLTVMAIKAREKGWKFNGVSIEVEKVMTTKGPRKIKELTLNVEMPQDLNSNQLIVLKNVTKDCPVLQNLKDSIKITVNWKTKKRIPRHC